MTAIWILLVAADAPEPQAQLEASLAGPACALATLEIQQSAQFKPVWKDSERYRVTAKLEEGAWSEVAHTQLEDLDPDTPLNDGAYPFFLPGVGAWPRTTPDPVWGGGLPEARAVASGWLWTTPSYRLSWQPKRINLEAPDRVVNEDGWMEDLVWTLTLDGQGRPAREVGSAKAGKSKMGVQVQWSVDYTWSACP